MLPPIETYLSNLNLALDSEGAHQFYFPMDQTRKAANLRLARELAFGLKDYSKSEVETEIGSLYGKMIVKHSLDRTGVAISAKEWYQAIRLRLAELGYDDLPSSVTSLPTSDLIFPKS